MQHRETASFFERIQMGNIADLEKYHYPKNLEYGISYDEKKLGPPPEIFARMRDSLPLKESYIKITKQYPGQTWPMHVDNYHAVHHDQMAVRDWSDPNIRRLWIALEDWDWGHYILFGNMPWHGWQAGDIVYFEWLVPHGTANCGKSPRLSMFVTGFMTDELRNWIASGEFRTIEV